MNWKLISKVSIWVIVYYMVVGLIVNLLENYWQAATVVSFPVMFLGFFTSSAYITFKQKEHTVKNLFTHVIICCGAVTILSFILVYLFSSNIIAPIQNIFILLRINFLVFLVIGILGFSYGLLLRKRVKSA